jgi:O-antigen/teichoic acid export membrane protein
MFMGLKEALRSLSFLWLGSLIGSGSTFLVYLILAREVGPTLFGLFSSAMATIMIFSLLAGFGVPQVWLKLFGKEGWGSIRWITPSLVFVGFTLLLITVIIVVLTFLGFNDTLTNNLLLLLLFFIYGYISVQLVSSKLQLEERYKLLTFWQMMPNFSRLVIIAAAYYLLKWQLSILDVGFIYAVIGLCFTIVAIIQLNRFRQGKVKLKGHENSDSVGTHAPTVKEVFNEAWPFGFAGLFAFIYIQSDLIMVKYLTGNTEAGYYNVAYTILSAIMTIPIILFSKFLIPKYHRWSNHNKEKFYSAYKKGNLAMLVSGVAIFLGVVLLSWFFIPLLFGREYIPSVQLLNILAVIIPFSFLSYSYGATLLTNEHMKLKVKLMGSVAIFNVILNFVLIPRYGGIGAAISTLLSNILLMLFYRHNARKRVF